MALLPRLPGLRLALGLAVTLAVLTVLALVADVTRLRAAAVALAASPVLLVVFLASYTLAFWFRALAWRRLLPDVGSYHLFQILQAALLVNHLLPVKAGEVLRPYLAVRRGVLPARALATTVVARWLDLLSLLALVLVLLPQRIKVTIEPIE